MVFIGNIVHQLEYILDNDMCSDDCLDIERIHGKEVEATVNRGTYLRLLYDQGVKDGPTRMFHIIYLITSKGRFAVSIDENIPPSRISFNGRTVDDINIEKLLLGDENIEEF